jgi:hypothetical protein
MIHKLNLWLANYAGIATFWWRHTDASHVEAEPLVSTQEQLVVVSSKVRTGFVLDFAKTVQTKLPGKGEPRAMTKVFGEYLLKKLFFVMHDKGPSVGQKGYNARVVRILNSRHHSVEFLKRLGDDDGYGE